MASIMRMPEVLANATEAIIAKWLIAEGESFTDGQAIAEVETEKALVEVPGEGDGVLGRYLAKEGSHVQVGAPIAVLTSQGEGAAEIEKAIADAGVSLAPAAPEPTPAPAPAATTAAPAPVAAATPTPAAAPTPSASLHGTRLFLSPLARRLAKESGLDPAQIQGTGPDGRIVRRDVQAAIAKGGVATPKAAVPALPNIPAGSFTDIPHSGMRKAIARRLTESKSSVPHFYLSAPVLADDFLNFRKKYNDWAPKKVSVTDLILKTVAAAFSDVPAANCIWTDTAVRQFADVDVSVAVATDNGLLTPVVRGINHLNLEQLGAVTEDLIARARAGRLKQNEIEGGSFSVTNLGMYGTD